MHNDNEVLRLVRLAKLARGLRVVRMARIMDSLNLLPLAPDPWHVIALRLKSIGASVSMLMWSMLLLAVIQCTAGHLARHFLAVKLRLRSAWSWLCEGKKPLGGLQMARDDRGVPCDGLLGDGRRLRRREATDLQVGQRFG